MHISKYIPSSRSSSILSKMKFLSSRMRSKMPTRRSLLRSMEALISVGLMKTWISTCSRRCSLFLKSKRGRRTSSNTLGLSWSAWPGKHGLDDTADTVDTANNLVHRLYFLQLIHLTQLSVDIEDMTVIHLTYIWHSLQLKSKQLRHWHLKHLIYLTHLTQLTHLT